MGKGVYTTYDRETGRGWVQNGRSRKILWTGQMLSDLRNYFPVMKNEELAGMLGVGQRTMIRKARELKLEKDKDWLSEVWEDHRRLAHMMSRAMGYPGAFQKGQHANPAGEFRKGESRSEEVRQKQSASMRRWHQAHRSKSREIGQKAWVTRRERGTDKVSDETRRKQSESRRAWLRRLLNNNCN